MEKTRRLSIEKDLRARAVRTDSLAEGNDAPKTENLRQRWQKINGTQSKTWAQYLVSLLDWVERSEVRTLETRLDYFEQNEVL